MFRDRRVRGRLNRKLEEIDHEYSTKLSKATGVDHEQLEHDHRRETDDCLRYLWYNEPVRLLRKANRYDLDYSNRDWYVDRDQAQGLEILTPTAQRELCRLIHAERRSRIEWWITKAVLPILQSIAVIIGVLIGLFAILKQ